ncbi:hypothetical protein BpHYR1_003908 [Brachionus plicatilis]|uniref:Uncharacterized protein n=1 Tax=Brachionus plicatilis TaxID=10195 RepID=A0A3M7PV00_BRAPC|nr:hypothetical protein BpHYR1_003908 [Brachionus plicatilis]
MNENSKSKNAIKITIPKVNKNAIEKIDEIFKEKGIRDNRYIKWNFETDTVRKEKLNDYLKVLYWQFGIQNDQEEKASLAKLFWIESGKRAKFIANEKPGEFLLRLVYFNDIDDLTKQIKIFTYKINFKGMSSWFGLFEDKLPAICTEYNMRMYLYYKLAEYSKNHDQDIQIEYSEQPKI